MKRLGLILLGIAGAFGQERPAMNPPVALPAGVVLKPDVVYAGGGDQALRLDLFLPRPAKAPSPAIVFIGDENWHGDPRARKFFSRQAAAMAADGFAGACIELRDSREEAFPAPLGEARAAVRWFRAHAAEYHVDPEKVIAVGGSAGGNLAVLLGLREEKSSRVAAVVAFNPLLDLVDLREGSLKNYLKDYLRSTYAEQRDRWREASPVYWVDRGAAPLLILQGDADETAPAAQAVDLIARLNFAGVRAELFTAPGQDHDFFLRSPWYERTLARMKAFLAPWRPHA